MSEFKFKTSTIGLMASHRNLKRPLLIRIELYRDDKENVKIVPVSGHNLERIGMCPVQEYTAEKFETLTEDLDKHYGNEYDIWMFRQLGFSVGADEDEY